MALRYKDIGEIISLIDASDCEEFILETNELKLVLRRRGGATVRQVDAGASADKAKTAAASANSGPPNPGTSTSAGGEAASAATPPKASAVQRDGTGVVAAPMVGTFYRAPAPSASPFVEVGSKVKRGDPLCLIEVMKLFTTIYAEVAGTVTEIGAEDGQFVEYGQTLFVIQPE